MADELATAQLAGAAAGQNAAEWTVQDLFTNANAMQAIANALTVITQADDGDPAFYDTIPAPLSGEWAGGSLNELSSLHNIDLNDPDIADAFESGFSEGYVNYIVSRAHSILNES